MFGYDLDSGFPLGQVILVVWQPFWAILVILTEGYWMGTYSEAKDIWTSGRWKDYTRGQRLTFWWGIVAVTLPFTLQNMFDWFFSNAIQSYVMVVIYSTIFLIIAVKQKPPSKV